MSPEKELLLTFEWDGKTVHKEASGFSGKNCTIETDFIEAALKAQNGKRRFKPEYLRTDTKVQEKRIRT